MSLCVLYEDSITSVDYPVTFFCALFPCSILNVFQYVMILRSSFNEIPGYTAPPVLPPVVMFNSEPLLLVLSRKFTENYGLKVHNV